MRLYMILRALLFLGRVFGDPNPHVGAGVLIRNERTKKFIRADQPLRDSFPDLFRLARVPDASVADHLQILGSSHHWDVVFSRQAQDWELEIVSGFMELLYSYPIRRGSLDEMCWRPSW
uniref:Uncharacterized protein n=1 Tax=Fagus sylvatica TaxID=28930 RepID=A0A2N9FDT7_FAGSY